MRLKAALFSSHIRREEAGYSLAEVMVAILLLTIAIIPMVGMFDMGLTSVARSGNYDRARSLANLKLEEAKSLPYESPTATDVKNDFPIAVTSTPDANGHHDSDYLPPEAGLGTEFAGLDYRVEKQYLSQPGSTSPSENFAAQSIDAGLMRVTVTVRWNGSNTYSTSGVVTR